ncbi:DNA-3-methyladenine glycosylase 2 family protein [Streptomyces sp. ST2-7A]|uniref:DNA-3-methyladenine glycosylase 2 family protein n=1 Tax=Streptomyces sp. ST2-7A TaxID=2907214 RepID=UPI0022775AB0|nr:AlkA N-terminal domain-containing protein [Streptomyces sp. ST2-7A]
MDDETRYAAVRGRDARFDGVFFTCVTSTGIYCRPSCPARTPKRENVRFLPSAAAAGSAGFRACRRCRPDAVPGSPEWNPRGDVVARAVRLIADGVVDREGVPGLAHRVGYSPRQLQRRLIAELGAGAGALARAQRAHTARLLLQSTELPITEVAFAAGFASVRQFNETIRELHDRTPGELRAAVGRARRSAGGGRLAGSPAGPGARGGPTPGEALRLRLPHRGPYAVREILDFLTRRAVPGIEEVSGAPGARRYRRTLPLPHGHGVLEIREDEALRDLAEDSGNHPENGSGGGRLPVLLRLTDHRDLTAAVQRVRCLFDLDADPFTVAERLGGEPLLADAVRRRPGLRSPGAIDPVEAAVRAVLGQQVTVAAARTLTGRLVAALGTPLPVPDGGLTHLFPTADALAAAPLGPEDLSGLPAARRRTLHTVAEALADGRVRLDPGADREETERALLALPGIGPWTAGYLRMRALGDPDVLLTGDAGVRAGLARLGVDPAGSAPLTEAWRPWRSYAVHHLWRLAAGPAPAEPAGDGPPDPDRPGPESPIPRPVASRLRAPSTRPTAPRTVREPA